MLKLNEKGFSQAALFIILLVGLAIAVYLVQTRTNLLPKADELKSCNNYVVKNRICGQDAYAICDEINKPQCTKDGEASYKCKADARYGENPNCEGEIKCPENNYICDARSDLGLFVESSAVCAKDAEGSQVITAKWGDVSDHMPAVSYQATLNLYPTSNLNSKTPDIISMSACLNARAITSRSHTFAGNYSANGKYRVIVVTYPEPNCQGPAKYRFSELKNATCSSL